MQAVQVWYPLHKPTHFVEYFYQFFLQVIIFVF